MYTMLQSYLDEACRLALASNALAKNIEHSLAVIATDRAERLWRSSRNH